MKLLGSGEVLLQGVLLPILFIYRSSDKGKPAEKPGRKDAGPRLIDL